MPMYSYECKKCKHKFDFLVMDEDSKPLCPECGSSQLDKLISGCNVGGSKSSSVPSMGGGGGGCGCHGGGGCPYK